MNDALIPMGAGPVTMTSREIADLTGKDHDNVRRDIKNLADALSLSLEEKSEASAGGRPSQVFLLSKRESLILVSGYSIAMRAKIIDRWQELEGQSSVPALPTYAAALRQLADQVEQGERQKQALALAAPKVEFVDRYVSSTGNKGFREVAKLLGANEAHFRAFLTDKDSGCMYRLAGALTPKQQHIDAGRFAVKAGTSEDTGHAFNQAKFTPKGVTWIAGEWAKHQLNHREAA